MSICKIGETKVINGVKCRKSKEINGCIGCHFNAGDGECRIIADMEDSIEDGGSECENSIWILADDQPEAPTATPPRDEVREQRRFEAAVAAMQGILASSPMNAPWNRWHPEECAEHAAKMADALLAELDRTGAGK